MARLDRIQMIERFRELAKMPITPNIEIGYIFWDKATGGVEMGGSHDNPEDLIKQLGMWRDSEIAGETIVRYEQHLRDAGAEGGAGLDAGRPGLHIVAPDGTPQ